MTMIDDLAERLFAARRDARAVPIDPALAALDPVAGYAVQEQLVARSVAAGARVIGWKIGLTSPAAMAAFGASEPIVGRLFEDSLLPSGASLAPSRTCAAKVEGEVLIELAAVPRAPFDDDGIRAAIASVRPAIEIADSRLIGWPTQAGPAIADNACCGWVVAGEPRGVDGLDLAAIDMRFTVDGAEVGRGTGADCLGSPLNVLRWFLEKAAVMGWRVEPGQLILTGAIAPPVPATRGVHHQASLSPLGSARFAFSEKPIVRT